MYRSYRIGELPDIEISNSALIAPIQALAMVYMYFFLSKIQNFNNKI